METSEEAFEGGTDVLTKIEELNGIAEGAKGDRSPEEKEIETSGPNGASVRTPGDAGDAAATVEAEAAPDTPDIPKATDDVPVADCFRVDPENEGLTEISSITSADVNERPAVPDSAVTGTNFDSHEHLASIRVLKPPGGGTSDIFGAPETVQNSPRRVVRNNLQSSVGFGPAINGEVTPRNKSGTNSYNRLFGPAETRPQSATKNRLKSNIFLSSDDSTSVTKDNNSNTPTKNTSTSAVDGPISTKDGNPVTGEGYTNGEKQPSANGAQPAAPTTNGTSHSAPPQRARVPPGGFSSGLW